MNTCDCYISAQVIESFIVQRIAIRRLTLILYVIEYNNILKVFKIFCIEHNLDSFDKLESVLDHKGDLHVSWNEKPNSLEKETISKIWELIGNEDKNNIKHYLLTPVAL